MQTVAVLTDSTAGLDPQVAAACGIGVVPLAVLDETGQAVAPNTGAVVAALEAGRTLTTSQPTPAQFEAAMRAARTAGMREIVSVHMSADMSGTYEAALRAAQAVGQGVRVLDSRTLGAGLGQSALAAARLAQAGQSARLVEAAARAVSTRSQVFFLVEDLGHLHRGGRVGAASALLGAALGVRPLLTIADGRISVRELVRGRVRARRHLVEAVAQAAGGTKKVPRSSPGPVRLIVHHVAAAQAAADLREELQARLVDTPAEVVSIEIADPGPVIAVHVGPGTVGVVVTPVLAAPHGG
ncbi:DegV family protein [Buchananella hordeovulneris]|uniref:Uncharacterized protein n=1 Tax=Buchananella hordeovulneris TaxID=52770 RepID=A0A1Q5PX58_9ACTO|nr:DegV family protein [Buchananella hordeovulneris]OKL52005.1 hypothetical protein BSZ40_03490 [Buchananella hordeovulneris]RRD45062.1 DegV family EDD domain-containing protein [Buchananella hordeovulneris]